MTTPEQKQPTQPDSSTLVHQRLHGGRTTISLRIKPEVKEAFTRRTRELGLSTCHVAEGLISGWLLGVNENVELVHQSPTMNITLVRDVKRVRRYAREVETVCEEVKEYVRHVCGFCGQEAKTLYRVVYASGKTFLTCPVCFEDKKDRCLVRVVLGEVTSP